MKRLIFCVALLAACGGGNGTLSFSVSTRAPASASSRALAVASNIDIQRVRINVGRLKLEGPRTGAAADGGDDRDGGDDDQNEIEIRQGPFLIDLDAAALNGVVTKVFDAEVPEGTYREFKFDIFPGASLQNASVVVDGTIGGASFTFTSSLSAQQKKEGSFVVGGSSSNITLSIDPRGWFGTATAQLDPRLASNRSSIENNIQSSFDVFEDDDRDGHR